MSAYVWSIDGGTIDAGQGTSAISVTWTTTGSRSVSVNYQNGSSCTAATPTNYPVTVNTVTASIGVTAPLAGNTTICAGTLVTFNASAADGLGAANYAFYVSSQGATPVQSGINPSYSTLNLQNGDQVYVKITDLNGCIDDSPIITMTVNPNPVVNLNITSAAGNTICAGETVEFTATAGYDTYNFYVGATPYNNGGNHVWSTTALANNDQIFVSATSAAGCVGNSAPAISMNVTSAPVVTLSTIDPITVCENTAIAFNASGATNYELILNGLNIGATPSSFNYNSASNYSIQVKGFAGPGCPGLSNVINVTIDKPTASFVLAPSTACNNSILTMEATGTGAAEYRFFIDNTITPVQDWSASNAFTHIYTSANNGQVVYVQSRSASLCTSDIVAGPTMTINPLPSATISLAAGSLNPVCVNENVTFDASTDFGDTYQFNINETPVPGATGTTFTSNTLSNGDIITVLITNSATGCSQLSNQIVMTVNPLPTAGLNVIQGSTNIIDGTLVEFQGTGGVDYNFEVTRGGVVVITQAFSNDDTFDNTTLQNGDVVTVTVRDANGCLDTESLTMTVLDQIVPQQVDANPLIYCIDDANGFNIWVNNPQSGVSYDLIRVDDNTNLGVGTYDGTVVRWNNMTNSTSGNNTYKVEAYYPSVPATRVDMANTIIIHRHDLPQVYALTVNPISGCINQFGLSNSDLGITYRLFADATLLSTIVVDGVIQPAGVLDFGTHNLTGVTYHVVASYTNLTTCDQPMTGDYAVASIAAQQLVTANPANGMYCQGGAGVTITLNGSEVGMSYWLQFNGIDVAGSEFISPANGATHTFAAVTADGTYRVVARVGGCNELMTNQSVTVQTIAPHPAMTLMPSATEYCEDVNGVTLTLSGFVTGYEYALIKDGGAAVYNNYDAFTNFPFDNQTDGNYSVRARHIASGCEDEVATAVIVENSLPTDIQIQADATVYCAGSTVRLFIPSSENGVRYELILDGTLTGQSVTSDTNGKPYEFFVNAEGTYTLHAINTITGCEQDLTGAVTITESPLPIFVQYSVVDGTDCNTGDVVTIPNPQMGVTYSIYSVTTGAVLPGYVITSVDADLDGLADPIVFDDIIDNGGLYYVVGETAFGCSLTMDYDANATEIFDVTIPGVVRKSTVQIPPAICLGDGGIVIQLLNAQPNVNYTLRRQGVVVETILYTGIDGGVVNFSEVFNEGIYDVVGVENLGTCENSMLNTVTIKYNPLPVSFKLNTSSGIYCDATAGASIELESSEAGGMTYYLMLNDPVNGLQLAATKVSYLVESPFVFDGITTPGNYTVYAKNSFGCTSNMENVVAVEQKAAPLNSYTIAPINECSTDGKVGVSISNYEANVTYTVSNEVNEIVFEGTVTTNPADVDPITFTRLAEGNYNVYASWGNGNCDQTSKTFQITVPVQPAAPAITINGNSNDITICGATETVTVQVVTPVSGLFYSLWQLDAVNGWVIHTTATAASDGVAAQEWIVSNGVATEGTFRVNASSYLDGSCPSTSNDLKFTMAAKPSLLTVSQSLTEDCSNDDKADVMISAYEANAIYTIVDKATSNVVFSGAVINTTATVDGLYYLTRLVTGDYSVSASFGGNIACATPLNDFAIAVLPLPVSPEITIKDPSATVGSKYYTFVCGNDALIEIDDVEVGKFYQLFKNSTPEGTSIEAVDAATIVNWTVTDNDATYFVRVSGTSTFGCYSQSNVVGYDKTLQPLMITPSVTGTCPVNNEIEVTFNAQANVIYTFEHQTQSANTKSIQSNVSGVTTLMLKNGNYTLKARWAVGNGCEVTNSTTPFPVVFDLLPTTASITVNSSAVDASVCGDEILEMSITGMEAGKYYGIWNNTSNSWLTGYEPTLSLDADIILNVSQSANVEVRGLNAIDATCYSASNSVQLSIGDTPATTTLWAAEYAYCPGAAGVVLSVVNPVYNEVIYELVSVNLDGTYTSLEVIMPTSFTSIETITNVDGTDENLPVASFKTPVKEGRYMIRAWFAFKGCNSPVSMLTSVVDITLKTDCIALIAIDDYLIVGDNDGTTNSINVFINTETGDHLDQFDPAIDIYNPDDLTVHNLEFKIDGLDKFSSLEEWKVANNFYGTVEMNPVTGEFIYTKAYGFYGTEELKYWVINTTPGNETRRDSATITIFVGNKNFHDQGTLLIPNSFSPNGDSFNDQFIISGNVDFEEDGTPINISEIAVNSSLSVYNRWGTLVYKSKNGKYDNTFDGKGNAGAMVSIGDDLPDGTYFYIFNVSYNKKNNDTPKTQRYNGFIELRR
jgi:hypothetical protein